MKPEPSMKLRPVDTRENDKPEEILREARERADYAAAWWADNFDLAADDVQFSDGGTNQWDPLAVAERRDGRRPVITVNSINQYLDQVQGQQRQAKPGIQVIPANDTAHSVEFAVGGGKRKVRGAELYEGIVRGIEYESSAERHYDKAFQHVTDGGFGWLRVVLEYAHGHSFDQKLRISHLRNRWSALIDPDAEQPDFSDANFGFVFTSMPRAEFQKRYPNAIVGEFASGTSDRQRDFWTPGGRITVAEYMTREPEERELVRLTDGATAWLDEIEDVLPELNGAGITVQISRKVVHHRTFWRLVTAWDVLEGPVELPFSTIPLVPVTGKEKTFRDGSTIYRSLIRDAKEPQKVQNVFLSSAVERIQAQPRTPYILTREAIENYEAMWARANIGNPAYLVYNEGKDKPYREAPPQVPTAELQIVGVMGDMMKAAVGIYDASLGARSNETSGKAIRARQSEADNASFTFVDNLAMAVGRIGRLLLEGIPKVYDSERVLRILGEDGAADWVVVNQVVVDEETGRQVVTNALGSGEWDLVVKTGPAYNTQREAAVEMMTNFLTVVPDQAALVIDKIAENSDWPGSREISKRFKISLAQTAPFLFSPEELEELGIPQADPNAPPPPEQQLALAQVDAGMSMAARDKLAADLEVATMQARAQQIGLAPPGQQPQQQPAIDPQQLRALVMETLAEVIAATQQPEAAE